MGAGAGSSQAGGIVFYLLDWKTFQRKCVGGYVEEQKAVVLNSKASHCFTLDDHRCYNINPFYICIVGKLKSNAVNGVTLFVQHPLGKV